MVPIIGGDGIPDNVFITALAEATELQPVELTTLKVYVPGESPDIVALFPDPVVVPPPGLIVIVQDPADGSPFSIILPAGTEHVG
jgi:hypothetical protein